MNFKIEILESFLPSKERILMDMCMKSRFVISENDVLAKHYSLIDAEIEEYGDFVVSTQWRIKGTPRDRFDPRTAIEVVLSHPKGLRGF